MEAHKPQPVPPICSRFEHRLQVDPPKYRLAADVVTIETQQPDRIELVEADCVGTRMIFGPGNRAFVDNAIGVAAEACPGRMQRELCGGGSYCQEAHSRTASSKVAIACEGAYNDFERERRSDAVSNYDNLVQ